MRQGVSVVIAINNIIAVKSIPEAIFSHLLIDGLNTIDKKTIDAGIANKTDAKNKFVGLPKILSPLPIPNIFFGTYNSK